MARTLTNKEKYHTYTDDIARPAVNVHDVERWVSSLAGGALVTAGLSRRNWKGLALATLGGILLSRGLSGVCLLYRQLGISTNAIGRQIAGLKVMARSSSSLPNRPRISRGRTPQCTHNPTLGFNRRRPRRVLGKCPTRSLALS